MTRLVFLCFCFAFLSIGCRDTKRACQAFADKHIKCMQLTQKRAMDKQAKLPPEQRKRSAPLLRQLNKRLNWKEWRQRFLSKCLEKPPATSVFQCIQKNSCDTLSQCTKVKS